MPHRLYIPHDARPFTQTNTVLFRGCRNLDVLCSPRDATAHNDLLHSYVGKLIESGFEVTGEQTLAGFKYDVMCRGFGEGHGITMVAILSGSDATLHAYIEPQYGVTAEFEFNLCYLPGRLNHGPAVEKACSIFKEWVGSRKMLVTNSKRRYLDPL